MQLPSAALCWEASPWNSGVGAVIPPEVIPIFKIKLFLLSSVISTEHHILCFTADMNECLCMVLSIAMKYIYVCIYMRVYICVCVYVCDGKHNL